MIYSRPTPQDAVDQGDIIENCPLVWFEPEEVAESAILSELPPAETRKDRVVVLTQTCDLAQRRVSRVVVAVAMTASELVESGQLKPSDIRGPVRAGRVFGWYFLPANHKAGLPELIVDFRELHTVPLRLLEQLCQSGGRRARVMPLYREHLARHYGDTYSRIGLPEPYATE